MSGNYYNEFNEIIENQETIINNQDDLLTQQGNLIYANSVYLGCIILFISVFGFFSFLPSNKGVKK